MYRAPTRPRATVAGMSPEDVPELVRKKAHVEGADAWLDALPELVSGLEREWSLRRPSPTVAASS